MTISTCTVGQLKRALEAVPNILNDRPIYIWIAGSYVAVTPATVTTSNRAKTVPNVPAGSVLVEGNIMPGSALDTE